MQWLAEIIIALLTTVASLINIIRTLLRRRRNETGTHAR